MGIEETYIYISEVEKVLRKNFEICYDIDPITPFALSWELKVRGAFLQLRPQAPEFCVQLVVKVYLSQ